MGEGYSTCSFISFYQERDKEKNSKIFNEIAQPKQ
jgi:hypothetical protein